MNRIVIGLVESRLVFSCKLYIVAYVLSTVCRGQAMFACATIIVLGMQVSSSIRMFLHGFFFFKLSAHVYYFLCVSLPLFWGRRIELMAYKVRLINQYGFGLRFYFIYFFTML